MIQTIKTPPRGTAGLRETSLLGGLDDAPLTPNAEVAQARIELISAKLSDTTGALIAQLEATLAMLAANDPVGAIYSLRRSRCYWQSISASAAELVSVDAEKESARRQIGERES